MEIVTRGMDRQKGFFHNRRSDIFPSKIAHSLLPLMLMIWLLVNSKDKSLFSTLETLIKQQEYD